MTPSKPLVSGNGKIIPCSFKGCEAPATKRHRGYGDLPFCDEHIHLIEEARREILASNTKALREKKGGSNAKGNQPP